MSNRRLKGSAPAVCEFLDSLGLKYRVEVSRHYKILVTLPNGRRRTIIASMSPSDHRSTKNKIAQMKRMLRAEGVEL